MAPIGVAILGSGIFVESQHKPACLQDPELLTLKAIYSRRKTSVESIIANETIPIDVYSDDSEPGNNLDDLLKRSDIAFVIIALPIPHQPEFIKKALSAGKHVLSEKPVAKDLATANELIRWKKTNAPDLIWSVAENFRYWPAFDYAEEKVKSLGKVLAFHVEVLQLVAPGGKYFETAWRKVPTYQGGFCLDAGVHFTAALRRLVGEDQIASLSAFTNLAQPHLPPIDTIMSTIKLKSGVCGTFAMSHGTPATKVFEWFIVCEQGTVKVSDGPKVVVKQLEMPEEWTEFGGDRNEWSGVKKEVRVFVESVKNGKGVEGLSPENALADLEMIEKMIQSGEQGGRPFEITGGIEPTSILGDVVDMIKNS
ncbi:hypothetical protein AOL_s00004g470 [Orbilia oligospora ATCC 24927]|uniref:Gfo/Idh/MocA-like oxidoreductase N-terminal domain-containing protein n=2 Tax=Orbilia oligospora TaxID=2813651 RepID=G1WYV9_ARTOA|nr:hypothetical protein AOL_s00004g470 [Orbilia oligospora ATCC 24927]EGX53811.1 hypothetical protein AOL_s00004g470 [Orbilia oligospora ATCC 24927]KAF3278284.1 hypothetical protein TWF970_004729 [Orbilia oligospora]